MLSFNWVGEALKALLVQAFLIAATSFYDDFTVVEVERLAKDASNCVERFFGLLGWRLKPLEEFAQQTAPLGAILDLSRCSEGVAEIRNRDSRVTEIVKAIDEAWAADEIDSDLLPRLRGRLLFSRSLAFGRCGGVGGTAFRLTDVLSTQFARAAQHAKP